MSWATSMTAASGASSFAVTSEEAQYCSSHAFFQSGCTCTSTMTTSVKPLLGVREMPRVSPRIHLGELLDVFRTQWAAVRSNRSPTFAAVHPLFRYTVEGNRSTVAGDPPMSASSAPTDVSSSEASAAHPATASSRRSSRFITRSLRLRSLRARRRRHRRSPRPRADLPERPLRRRPARSRPADDAWP